MSDDWTRAIDTEYAGCLFRSRLEARWAVFFDTLGIEWEYEPAGFEAAGHDTRGRAHTYRYLPDFWLPATQTWVEVKGSREALRRDAHRYTTMLDGESPMPGIHESWGTTRGLLILGTIPRPDHPPVWHWLIQHHKGLWQTKALFTNDAHLAPFGISESTPEFPDVDLAPFANDRWEPWHGPAQKAYGAARRARFEQGAARVGRHTVTPNGLVATADITP